MAKPVVPVTEQMVMANIGITENELERRRRLVGLTPRDFERIASARDLITRNTEPLIKSFFDFLASFEEARVLLGYSELTEQARALKRDHLLALVGGRYDLAYVEQRIKLALLYGRVGLDTKVFLGAFRHLLEHVGRTLVGADPSGGLDAYFSIEKIAFLDISVMIDVLVHERERVIRRQSEAIRELSSPVLQVRDRMLLLPLIGVIDTHRAQQITENLLDSVRKNRARVVVMDVTGVATIDSRVANHLVQTVSAARLMGCEVIVTGISADVAQSMVALGINLEPFRTVGDLQGGFEEAEHMLGYRLVTAET